MALKRVYQAVVHGQLVDIKVYDEIKSEHVAWVLPTSRPWQRVYAMSVDQTAYEEHPTGDVRPRRPGDPSDYEVEDVGGITWEPDDDA